MEKIIKQLKSYFIFLCFFLIVFIEFRGLILNINKGFIDWGDTPFIAWQIITTRDKLINFDFNNLDTTNSHYPYKGSLFFTDSFIGQSILSLPLFFIKNPVLLYNLIFLLTTLINYYAAYILFKKLTGFEIGGLLGSVFLNNSVYFFDQIIHLQTITYWPMLLVIYFLLKKKPLLAGVFLSVQFYMAIYLGIFSFFLVGIYLGLYLIFNPKEIKTILIHSLILGGIFLLLTYKPLIKKYLNFQKTYHQVRDINEIIANSGNITDYLYFLPKTTFSNIEPIKKYNKNVRFATERMSFPGIIIITGALLGIFTYKFRRKRFYFLFFTVLIIIGFVFSLGPRLMVNGQYKVTPLPYLLFLKQFDFLFSIRLTHRWAIFLIIGLVYFASRYYSKISRKFLFVILLLFFIESIPSIPFSERDYLTNSYKFLINSNLKNNVLLEYPLLNLEKGVGVEIETVRLLASTYHKMRLFNGYTGLFLPDYGATRIYLENFFPNLSTNEMLKALEIEYIRVDKRFLKKEELIKIKKYYKENIIYDDKDSIIIKIPINKNKTSAQNITVNFAKNHAYGKDRKLYVNLVFKNSTNKYYANLKQEKVTLNLTFYKKSKVIRRKQIYHLYPLIIFPDEKKFVTFELYEKPGFDKVKIDLINIEDKFVTSKILSL